jgi:ribosome maturation factor RimP
MHLFAQRLQGIDRSRLEEVIAPILSAHGVETAEISYQTERPGWVLRVTVESLAGELAVATSTSVSGIHLELLAEISRDLSAALDVADIVPHHYHLEVSSPGLERPLRSERDFRAAVGHAAKLHLSKPAPDGQSVLRGPILGVSDGTLSIEVDGKTREVALQDVGRAHLVFELPAQPKGKRAKPSSRAQKAAGPT